MTLYVSYPHQYRWVWYLSLAKETWLWLVFHPTGAPKSDICSCIFRSSSRTTTIQMFSESLIAARLVIERSARLSAAQPVLPRIGILCWGDALDKFFEDRNKQRRFWRALWCHNWCLRTFYAQKVADCFHMWFRVLMPCEVWCLEWSTNPRSSIFVLGPTDNNVTCISAWLNSRKNWHWKSSWRSPKYQCSLHRHNQAPTSFHELT